MNDLSDIMTDADMNPHHAVSEKEQVSKDWVLVYDNEADRDYYFNIETQESLWEPPEE